MIDYRAGVWGFTVAFGWNGSLAPRALTMAIPNAIFTFFIASLIRQQSDGEFNNGDPRHIDPGSKAAHDVIAETSQAAQMLIASFTSVMIFILYNRSNTAYDRWWEGGTLLQKTRGEWFNAYSSIMAFTSLKPELQKEVQEYVHLLARLMSLLMCCGLQQVSPNRDRPFEIIDLVGIEPASMEFLNQAPDKVEILLQWIQRSMVLHTHTGVLPVAPPILSRAFQEVSRGIVNLQNARKIADFPYPYPLAQVSMILQLIHYAVMPVATAMAMPRVWAVMVSFFSIFVLWCIHFNALDLEFPFGTRVNDLPMNEFQQDWNKSICTLLADRAIRPPKFQYEPEQHDELVIAMSDASDLYVPTVPVVIKGSSVIKVSEQNAKKTNRKKGATLRFSSQLTRDISASTVTDRKLSAKMEPPTTQTSSNGIQAQPSEPATTTVDAAAVVLKDKVSDTSTSATVIGATPPVLTSASANISAPTPGPTSASQILSEQISRGASPPSQPGAVVVFDSKALPAASVPPLPEVPRDAEGTLRDRQNNPKDQDNSNPQLHDGAGGSNSRLLKL